jgi:hypothetical protein
MAVDTPAIREVVERVFARQDVLNACKRRDLSTMITILGANGITQAEIAALMGKTTQGRLSEYKMHKRAPTMETFKKFADGLGLPPAARLALGLACEVADSGSSEVAGGRPADIAGAGWGMCGLCSATCRGLAPSRSCRRFAACIVAMSKRTG